MLKLCCANIFNNIKLFFIDKNRKLLYMLLLHFQAPQPQRPQTAAAPPPESAAGGDKNELKTLMEECKRLQAENASLKQKQSEQTVSTNARYLILVSC